MSRQKMIQLWNDWQLSSLVLLSLFLQLLFLFTARLRKCTRPSMGSKAYFWCLYNLSSPIAIYALGILSRASAGQADADIQAFWAALILFHLGGVDDFTALSLEDNNLWVRRCFTLSVQAATTAYVFFHHFQDPAFRCFIGPFWLIFLVGLFKCSEQVLALQQATMEALIGSVLGIPDPGPDYADTMDRVDGILRSGVLPSINIDNERVDRPNSDSPVTDEVEAERKKDQQQALGIIRSAHFLFSRFNVLFADGIFSFKDRQDSQAEFVNKDAHWAFRVVEIELSFVYDRLYTKASVSRTTMSGLLIRFFILFLTLAGSIWTLFITFGGSQYRLRNRCITYTLVAGAVVTDVVTLVSHGFSIWSLVHSGWLEWCSDILLNGWRRWSGYMAQSNLITFCLQELPSKSKLQELIRKAELVGHPLNRGALGKQLDQLPVAIVGRIFAQELRAGLLSFKRPISQKLLVRSFWSKYKHTRHVHVSEKLKTFIFDEIRKKEKHFNEVERERQRKPGEILDNHNPFTSYRGDQVMQRQEITGLEWSLQEKDFDESLVLWHIATELCFRQEDKGNTKDDCDQDTHSWKGTARELSNYLFYIMMVHPLMLSPPTTMAIKRCRDTCAEARRHFLKEHLQHMQRPTSEGSVSEENARLASITGPRSGMLTRTSRPTPPSA